MKIVESLGDNKYIVEIPNLDSIPGVREESFGVVHDYVYFKSKSTIPDTKGIITSDSPSYESIVQINIRDFNEIILPYINKHKYCQPEHLFTRSNGTNPYTYSGSAIRYYSEENKCVMVAFRKSGEITYSHVSLEIWVKYVKPGLISEWEEHREKMKNINSQPKEN